MAAAPCFVGDCFGVRPLRRLCVNHRWRFLISGRRRQCPYTCLFILLNEITAAAAEGDQEVAAEASLDVILMSKLAAIHALEEAREIASREHAPTTAAAVTAAGIFLVGLVQQSGCSAIKHARTPCCKAASAARIEAVEKRIIPRHCNEVFSMSDNRWQISGRQSLLETTM